MSLTQEPVATTEPLPTSAPPLPEREAVNVFAVEDTKGPVVLRMSGIVRLTDKRFLKLCQQNDPYRLERTAEGDLEIMAPVVWNGGKRNAHLTTQLGIWTRQDGTGESGDSSTGYRLPNNAIRSPDASWISNARLATVSEEQYDEFLPLAPDFAVELRSPSDRMRTLQRKMVEYVANGVRLGLLLDPIGRTVAIYRPGVTPIVLNNPTTVDCAPELPGFVLDIQAIFTA